MGRETQHPDAAQVTYAIGIVAHPHRAGDALALRDKIRADVVSFDHDGIGGRANHLRVLTTLAGTNVNWAVILEDDALPCRGFHDALGEWLRQAPSPIVSLYLGTGRWAGTVPSQHEPKVQALIDQADTDGSRWILGGMWHAVGYAIRSDTLEAVIQRVDTSRTPIDQAIGRWAKENAQQVAYTWPSLVDHKDNGRLVDAAERNTTRRAWRTYNPHTTAHASL